MPGTPKTVCYTEPMARRLSALGMLFGLAGAAAAWAGDLSLILPFHNATGNPTLDWIGESVAETTRETLSSYHLPVVQRGAEQSAAGELAVHPAVSLTKASIIRLGLDVAAARVIYGRFEYLPGPEPGDLSRGVLRFAARGIDVDRLAPGGEWIEEGPMAGLSQLQTRLAWRILRDLHPGPAPHETEFFSSHPPIRLDALESYARGLLAVAPEEKHRLFSLAVNLEPEFSPPKFQLGLMYWESDSYRAAGEWLERVNPRDAHYLEANFLLGLCRYHLGDYSGALAAFEVVARTVPGDFVYNNIGLAQYRLGMPAALESLRWAMERDPDDPDYRFNLGYVLWRGGRLEEAAEHLRVALQIDPRNVGVRRLLDRCEAGSAYQRGDLGGEGLERLKSELEPIRGWRNKDTARGAAGG